MSDEKDVQNKNINSVNANANSTNDVAHDSNNTQEQEQTQPVEISTKEAYFVSLNAWVKNANISQNAMALFPWYLLSSYPQLFQSNGAASGGIGINAAAAAAAAAMGVGEARNQHLPNTGFNANANNNAAAGAGDNAANMIFGSFRVLDERTQLEVINQSGGYEYIVAPFWKRAIAEFIDILILLLLKVIITFTVMNIFNLDLGFDLDKDTLQKVINDSDYSNFLAVSMDFLALSSDLLMLEVLTKVIVCFYEAICTTFNNGSTPGKSLLSLRIKYVEAMLPLQPPQPPQFALQAHRIPISALILPAETPSFKRALVRAIAKNLIITLLFPMCFVMVFFKNNRTVYDIMTKTIVVEDNPNPVLRRPR